MIKVTKVGDVALQKTIDRLTEFMQVDLANKVMDESLAILLSNNRKRFLQQVDPDGVPWVPSWGGIRRKEVGRGGGTLFDTGRLFHSIQAVNNRNFTGSVYTDVPYAEDHQEGLNGNVKRVFLGVSVDDESIVSKLIEKRMTEVSNAAGTA